MAIEKTSFGNYHNILSSTIENPSGLKVGFIEINRPKAKNALNTETMVEIVGVLEGFDIDKSVGDAC